MSDNNATPSKGSGGGGAWTDRERLAYLFLLLENTGKPNFNDTPLPAGRTLVACQLMVKRMKSSYKDEIESIKAGTAVSANGEAATKTPKKTTTSRKRKATETPDVENGAGGEVSPKKRGRKNKADVAAKCEDQVKEDVVKNEPEENDFNLDEEV